MNRLEFMKKLRMLLMDVDESEREEALSFYENYFDDAGIENEQEVIASLGTPERVARTIKEGLRDEGRAQGEFTENGYSGYGETEKKELAASEKVRGSRGTGGWILLLIAAVFALPILGPLLLGIVSTLFSILILAVLALFGMIIVGIGLLVAGAGVFAAAIACLLITPAVGIILFGISLLLLGFGILAVVLGIWIVTKVVPAVIRLIVNGVSRLFKKKGGQPV